MSNNTLIAAGVLVAAGVGFMMFSSKAERIKQKEESMNKQIFEELEEKLNELSGITPGDAQDIAQAVMTKLPVIETAFERDIWRETLSDKIFDFLGLDGSFSSAQEFLTLSSNESTQNLLRGMSIADINDLTQTGSFENAGFQGAKLVPGTFPQMIFVNFHAARFCRFLVYHSNKRLSERVWVQVSENSSGKGGLQVWKFINLLLKFRL